MFLALLPTSLDAYGLESDGDMSTSWITPEEKSWFDFYYEGHRFSWETVHKGRHYKIHGLFLPIGSTPVEAMLSDGYWMVRRSGNSLAFSVEETDFYTLNDLCCHWLMDEVAEIRATSSVEERRHRDFLLNLHKFGSVQK